MTTKTTLQNEVESTSSLFYFPHYEHDMISTFVFTGAFSTALGIGMACDEGREGRTGWLWFWDWTARIWMDGWMALGLGFAFGGWAYLLFGTVILGATFGQLVLRDSGTKALGLRHLSEARSINVMTFQTIHFGNSDNQKRHPGIKLQIQRKFFRSSYDEDLAQAQKDT
jgi:hypothetical protein